MPITEINFPTRTVEHVRAALGVKQIPTKRVVNGGLKGSRGYRARLRPPNTAS